MHVPRTAVTGSRRPLFVARRRRRLRPLLLSVGVIMALLVWMGSDGRPMAALSDDAPPEAAPTQPRAAEGAVRAMEPPDTTPPLADFGGLELRLPTDDPVIVGFHEASTPEALEMSPLGQLTENENTTKFDPPEEIAEGADYLVMSSRGRRRAATSAVDVVMQRDDPVLSPVTGTVTDVRNYFLYGSHEDYRIEIAPHDRPELRVVLIHLDGVEVEVGDDLEAGRSTLAGTARPFPFGSQVDRYTEPDRWPHVHIEVKVEDDEDDEDDA